MGLSYGPYMGLFFGSTSALSKLAYINLTMKCWLGVECDEMMVKVMLMMIIIINI